MSPQVLEGTVAEIQEELNRRFSPKQRLRAVISEFGAPEGLPAAPFRPEEFRNGVPLLPRRDTATPVTLELVQQLLDQSEPELSGAD